MNNEEKILELVSDNNRMLKEIIEVINAFGRNLSRENIDDFGRNILANLISNNIDIKRFK